MKKLLAAALSLLLVLTLFGCVEQEEVKFYESKTCIRQSTGDINLRENTYDENWNLTLSYTTLNGNYASKVEYEYSKYFTVMTMKSSSATDKPEISRVVRTFDDQGQVIQAENYDGDQLVSTTEYTYDDNGEQIIIKTTYPENDTRIIVQRIFDDHGNLITYIQDTGYSVGRYEYAYNDKNQRIREEYYRDDVLLDSIDFIWEGNVGTGTSYKADGIPLGKRLLEYDEYGNMLRLESQDRLGAARTVICYEYIGTDGSTSSGILE